MAKTNNPLLTGYKISSGVTNKQFILKKRKNCTIISKSPDMSKVIPSAAQIREKSRFAEAVKYAKSIVNDPILKAGYKARPGSTVYHSAIKDYLDR
jgi:hypothetical protein